MEALSRRHFQLNIADDRLMPIVEMAQIAGIGDTSAGPLTNPWQGQVDTTPARSLGSSPEILTVWQARRDGLPF